MNADFPAIESVAPSVAAPAIDLPGERVTYLRRILGSYFLEYVLVICTLAIGWFIWFCIASQKGQTPAKQLLHIYIYDLKTGAVASAGKVWLREAVGKFVIPWVFAIAGALVIPDVDYLKLAEQILSEIYHWGGMAMIFFNPLRRAVWDFHAGTAVRYMPNGPVSLVTSARSGEARLRELEELRERALITDAEYMRKRREILASL